MELFRFGKYSHPFIYKLTDVGRVVIVIREESNWPEHALLFFYHGEPQVIGIDDAVSMNRLAQSFHAVGIPVRLNGWKPSQDNEFEKTFRWHSSPQHLIPTARVSVPLAGFMAAAEYTDRFAAAATSDALIRGAKVQISRRSERLIDPDSKELIPVEVFDRAQFAKTVQKVSEVGFVQIHAHVFN